VPQIQPCGWPSTFGKSSNAGNWCFEPAHAPVKLDATAESRSCAVLSTLDMSTDASLIKNTGEEAGTARRSYKCSTRVAVAPCRRPRTWLVQERDDGYAIIWIMTWVVAEGPRAEHRGDVVAIHIRGGETAPKGPSCSVSSWTAHASSSSTQPSFPKLHVNSAHMRLQTLNLCEDCRQTSNVGPSKLRCARKRQRCEQDICDKGTGNEKLILYSYFVYIYQL